VIDRPARVAVFTGGPYLEPGLQDLLGRLEEHPDVDLAGVVWETADASVLGAVRDAVRRRGLLAGPVLAVRAAGVLADWVGSPRVAARRRRRLRSLAGRIRRVPDIHAPEVVAHVRALAPDLGLIYGSPILRPELFGVPRLGTLGVHHGRLPDYRGKKTTFWAMVGGEAEAWVTIQRVNAQLDAGEIVREGSVPIGRRSHAAVWRDVEALGVRLFVEAVTDVARGTATFRRPDDTGRRKRRPFRDPTLRDVLRYVRRRLFG
jgi:folate-dependent phosphoribosylglycinamide formyltransferase PurN